jgi:hypothetical protein
MKHFWMGVAIACISGAVVSLWWQHYDAAFVIGTMGALAWFLNYRAGLKKMIGGELEDDESRESNED